MLLAIFLSHLTVGIDGLIEVVVTLKLISPGTFPEPSLI